MRNVVVFDGVCNLCNRSVNFIIKRDQHKQFRFTPMQSPLGQQLMKQYGIDDLNDDTLLLIKQGECFVYSDAALEIAADLDGFWRWFGVLRVIPKPIRDGLYRLIGRNRYRLFGRTEQCSMPGAEHQSRFL